MDLNPLKGMRDFEPKDMIIREKIMRIARNIFERYGFDPLETPAIESLNILTGKYGEDEKLIWRFKDLGERDVALRYDLTVPLARFVAKKKRLPMPFKRYQIGRVWRYDNPQRGRYREFWQCDVDTVGSSDMYSDAEIIQVIYESLKAIGIDNFIIKLNNRKLSDGILELCGVPKEKVKEALRSIDKLDKIGVEGVKKELYDKGFDEEKILEFISKDMGEIPKLNEVGEEGRKELEEIADYLKAMNVKFKIDLSIARGLDYYTGMVFEVVVPESGVGSISAGGRYDDLIGIFLGQKIPAVGGSLGIERIADILSNEKTTKKDILVIPINVDKREIIPLVEKLRDKYNVDVSMKRDIKKSMHYAESVGIRYVCLMGKKEISSGRVKIKKLDTGEEKEMDINSVELF